jgi:hypothetical protein
MLRVSLYHTLRPIYAIKNRSGGYSPTSNRHCALRKKSASGNPQNQIRVITGVERVLDRSERSG